MQMQHVDCACPPIPHPFGPERDMRALQQHHAVFTRQSTDTDRLRLSTTARVRALQHESCFLAFIRSCWHSAACHSAVSCRELHVLLVPICQLILLGLHSGIEQQL